MANKDGKDSRYDGRRGVSKTEHFARSIQQPQDALNREGYDKESYPGATQAETWNRARKQGDVNRDLGGKGQGYLDFEGTKDRVSRYNPSPSRYNPSPKGDGGRWYRDIHEGMVDY